MRGEGQQTAAKDRRDEAAAAVRVAAFDVRAVLDAAPGNRKKRDGA
jgi:hypothetical protein